MFCCRLLAEVASTSRKRWHQVISTAPTRGAFGGGDESMKLGIGRDRGQAGEGRHSTCRPFVLNVHVVEVRFASALEM